MRTKFERQLLKLNNELVEMGALVEQAIQNAITALIKKDIAQAKSIIDADQEVNALEGSIEAYCMKLILQQQPVASDLRLISAALKMVTDMERIGDHASDISEITIALAEVPYSQELSPLPKMADEAITMVSNSIHAFVISDLEMAQEVIEHDDVVDRLFDEMKQKVIDMFKQDDANHEEAVDILMAAKYLERTADHATNIAEWVIYSITGTNPNTQ